MVLCFISSLLLSLGTMMVSHMKHFHPITKSFWRFAGTFIPSIFVVAYYVLKGENLHSTFWPMNTRKAGIVMVSLLVSISITELCLQFLFTVLQQLEKYWEMRAKKA